MTQELKSMRGAVTEFFRDEKGGIVTFTVKNQVIRAMFFQNCVFINGKRVLVKDLTIGQIRKFLKVGDEVEFDCIPNPKPNSYQIRWKCTNLWKGQRPLASQKLPSCPSESAVPASVAGPAPAPAPSPAPAPAPVQRAQQVSQPAQPPGLPVGIVVHAEGDHGVISIKRIGAPGEDFCRYARRLCFEADFSDVVRFSYHQISKAVTVAGFKCIYEADKVIRDRNLLDYDEDELNRLTGVVTAAPPTAPTFKFVAATPSTKGATGTWTQVESKKSKSTATEKTQPVPPAQPTVPAARNPLPEEFKSSNMLFNQMGCIKEDFGWKAVVEFNYDGVGQRALLLSKKYDPPVETFEGILQKGDLVDFDCHEYRRPDGSDNVTWFVARAKKIPDRASPPQEDHPVVSLVGVTATVKVVDDVNHSGILELLAASSRGNNVYFEADCVLVDKRPVSRDLPLSAQVTVGDVVKVNVRPACESDPLDFPWVAEKMMRETRRFSAAVSCSSDNEVNNNKPMTPTFDYSKIADDLRELEDEINWDDEEDLKGQMTNGEHPAMDVLDPSPRVASPPMSSVTEAQQQAAAAQFFELPPISASLPESLKALMHSQYVQNRLIMALLQSCPLEINLHAQATQNKLILGLLEACTIEAVHSHVPLMKTWMDLNPTLQFAVKEILTKRATMSAPVPQAPVYRDRVGSGIESTLSTGFLHSAQNSYGPHLGMDGPVNVGLTSVMNSVSSSTSSSPANRYGTYSPFEPARPGASASPLAAAAGYKNVGINVSSNPSIAEPKTITCEVMIVRIIDESKGIARVCDGGPYHGEDIEFTKQSCRFLGLKLSPSVQLSSVARPEGRGLCRAVRNDAHETVLWRAEELHIQ